MDNYPEKLAEYLEFFNSMPDRSERIDILTSFAEGFEFVPDTIAVKPYPQEHRVEACESEVYFWARETPDKRLRFYFAVENPQGIAAMATVYILGETLSGAPLDEILKVDPEIVLKFFGTELSTRKRIGLMQIVKRIQQTVQAYQETGTVR